jgi:hypothetical protein
MTPLSDELDEKHRFTPLTECRDAGLVVRWDGMLVIVGLLILTAGEKDGNGLRYFAACIRQGQEVRI